MILKLHVREVVVAKFEALLRSWCEGTAEYNYKLRTHGRNSILQQTSYKTLTHSIAGAEGISVQGMLLASPTAVCVCVRACVSATSKHYRSRSCGTNGAELWYIQGFVC